MRIAREMGWSLSDVDALTVDEFDEWRAYFELEPPMAQVLEMMIAQLCQIQIAGSGAKKVPELDKLMPMAQSVERAIHKRRNSVADFVRHLSSTGRVIHGGQ